MKEFKHVIADPMGLHARPAGMLVKAVAPYAMELTIQVEGADEETAAAELQAFMAANL